MGSVFKFVPNGSKNEEDKYNGLANHFNMIKLINDTQNQCVEETLECARIEYNKLLRQKQLPASNPQFYLKIKNIFEATLENLEYNHNGDTYCLLVYFILEYIQPFDIEMESDDITIVGKYSNENERCNLSIMNLLLSNYKEMLKIKKVKPIDILAGFRAKI